VAGIGARARAHVELRGTRRGAGVRCYGKLDVTRRPGISVGDKVIFLGGPIPTSLRCEPGAELVVGDRSIWNYGALVVARRSVRVGANCMIASHVYITDDDGRRSGPVTIGDGTWIAHGAVIEPGTVLGEGSVVSTLSVVSGIVPPRSLVAGNPAHVLPLEPSPPRAEGRPDLPPPPSPASLPVAEDLRAAIIEWLDDTRCFGEAARLITSDAMSLRDAGLLDSLGLVQLVLSLEMRFGVAIDRQRAAHPAAHSVRGLLACMTATNGVGSP
jgi:maltose O-acetyltransferase